MKMYEVYKEKYSHEDFTNIVKSRDLRVDDSFLDEDKMLITYSDDIVEEISEKELISMFQKRDNELVEFEREFNFFSLFKINPDIIVKKITIISEEEE